MYKVEERQTKIICDPKLIVQHFRRDLFMPPIYELYFLETSLAQAHSSRLATQGAPQRLAIQLLRRIQQVCSDGEFFAHKLFAFICRSEADGL